MSTHDADEPFHVVGQAVQRRDALGHVTGRTQYFEDIRYPGLLHLKMHRARAPPRADQRRRPVRRRGGHGRREGAHARGRAEQLVHDPRG